ncbi:MAG: hypothetical protein Kow0047_22790 [Anaerolineae bacterium]
MRTLKRIGIVAVTLALLGAFGVGAVAYAQAPTSTGTPGPTWPWRGWGFHDGWLDGFLRPHGLGLGFGLGAGPDRGLVKIAADVLDMDQADLLAQLHEGKSIADIAGDKTDEILNQALEQRKQALDRMVEAGRLTQEQADTILGWAEDWIQQALEQPFPTKEEILNTMLERRKEQLQALVDAGRLTQEQADTILGWMKDWIQERLDNPSSWMGKPFGSFGGRDAVPMPRGPRGGFRGHGGR